jgi:hypothetical protein
MVTSSPFTFTLFGVSFGLPGKVAANRSPFDSTGAFSTFGASF